MLFTSVLFVLLFFCFIVAPGGPHVKLLPFDAHVLEFSGNNFKNGKIWTPFTAMLMHDGMGHFFNNILFTVAVYATLEMKLSTLELLSMTTIAGVLGALVSGLHAHISYGIVGDFQATRGFSPAMYGVAFYAALVFPSMPVSDVFVVRSDTIMILIWFLPHVSTYWTNDPFMLGLLVTILGAKTFFGVTYSFVTAEFLFWYLLKCIVMRFYSQYVWKRISTADHFSHFGGTAFAILFGITCLNFPANWSNQWLWASFSLLFVRLYVDKKW